MPDFVVNSDSEKKRLSRFYRVFCVTAILQGRICYFLMSIHAVNPVPLTRLFNCDPERHLFLNMVYGFSLLLYSRPSMSPLGTIHRIAFSVMGSLMFNHASMLLFSWLTEQFKEKPHMLTFMGVFSGRVMLAHFLAYLYHVDSRSRGFRIRTHNEFEDMYYRD